METWVIFTFLYAIFTGFFQCAKKKAVEKNSIYEVLAYFSLIAFLLVAFTSQNVFNIEFKYLLLVLLKASVIVVSWLLSLYVISKMSISLYSVINLSRIIFSIILSWLVLGEKITATTIIGMIIVIEGLILVNKNSNKKEDKEASWKMIGILLISCLFNSISAIIDKYATAYITSGQLQFWFLFFLTVIYWIILLIKTKKTHFKNIKKNYWILVAAICLTVGDRFLFIANSIPESKVSVMTILKQISTIETIILGKLIFKEKNITKKLLCAVLIIFGIVITLI